MNKCSKHWLNGLITTLKRGQKSHTFSARIMAPSSGVVVVLLVLFLADSSSALNKQKRPTDYRPRAVPESWQFKDSGKLDLALNPSPDTDGRDLQQRDASPSTAKPVYYVRSQFAAFLAFKAKNQRHIFILVFETLQFRFLWNFCGINQFWATAPMDLKNQLRTQKNRQNPPIFQAQFWSTSGQ